MADTLPLHQTLSILSLFLLVISVSMSSYTQTQTNWMRMKLIIKTQPLGIFINNKYFPNKTDDDLMPIFDLEQNDDKDSQCDILSKLKDTLLKYPSGKLQIDVNIGLKDMCMFIIFRGFNLYSDILPQFYTCKKFDFLDDLGEEAASKIWNENNTSRKIFDSTIDVIDEVGDLSLAGISCTILALVTAFLKTPLIRNFLKNRKIFQAFCAIFTFAAFVAYTWAIILFIRHFDPEDILVRARQRAIGKKDKKSKFWSTSSVNQNKGKSFYLLVGSDAILGLVLLMSVVEYLSSRVVRRVPEDVQMSKEGLMDSFDE